MSKLEIITGGSHSDYRGTLTFFNDFDMQEIKRFYRIKHQDITIVRGWRGHQIEQRWFHICEGVFEVRLIQIDNWITPSPFLHQEKIVLSATDNIVLHIPAGYATAIKANRSNSELIVFADYSIDHAKNDDYLFPIDYFTAQN